MRIRNIFVFVVVALVLAMAGCAVKKASAPLADAGAAQAGTDQAAEAGADASPGAVSDLAAMETDADADARADAMDLGQAAPDVAAESADDAPLTPQEQAALASEPDIRFDLNAHDTKEIRQHFRYFTHSKKGRKTFQRWLDRSELYFPYVRRVLAERGLPGDLAFLPFVESGYNPKARSRAGAAGMWQFMPYTGKKFGLEVGWWVDERLDPYKATHAAADYLERLYAEFGDWYLALAAYNAGEGRVAKAIRKTGCEDFFDLSTKKRYVRRRGRNIHYLPRETRNYVPKMLAVLKIVSNLKELGFTAPDWDREVDCVSLDVPPKTDLGLLARASGLDWKEFRAMNWAFTEPAAHPDKPGVVYMPSVAVEAAKAHLAGDPKPYTSYYTMYRVRSGDSWYRISRRCGVSIRVLKKYNNRTSDLLRPGQKVKIPGRGEASKTASVMRSGGSRAKSEMAATRALARKRSKYTVGSGDSLWSLAKRHHMTVETLARSNGLSSRSRLKVGQKLYIPDQGLAATRASHREAEATRRMIVYEVRRGDSLWSIARRHDTTVAHLARANNLSRGKPLQVGQELSIPGQDGQSPSSGAARDGKVVYRVRPGDSLWSIARHFGVSATDIRSWNSMSSSRIYPGDSITVFTR